MLNKKLAGVIGTDRVGRWSRLGSGMLCIALAIAALAGAMVLAQSNLAAAQCVPPPSGMVSWWPGEGHANDIVDQNHGTLVGSGTYPLGVVGQTFCFAGGYVEVPSSPDLNFWGAYSERGDLSIDAWIKTCSTAALLPIVDKRDLSTGSIGYMLFLYNGNLALQLGDGTFYNYFDDTGAKLYDGNWHHVAVTVDRSSPTGLNLYVDGAVVLNYSPMNRPGSLANNQPLFIGRHATYANMTFDGCIDEVEIFHRALSAQEVLGIFNAGSSGKCSPVAYDPLASFEDLLRRQSEGLGSFECLLNVGWGNFTPEQQLAFLGSFEDLLRRQAERLESFEDLLHASFSQLTPQQQVTFLQSFEDLLRRQAERLESFEELLKAYKAGHSDVVFPFQENAEAP
jgi:hypothetical protein